MRFTAVIKTLSFNNADIFFIELDSLRSAQEIDEHIARLKTELSEIVGAEYFDLHLYGTKLSKMQLNTLIELITENQHKFRKLAVVGVSLCTRLQITRLLKTNIQNKRKDFLHFFSDYQKSKEWLVNTKAYSTQ